jgi:hypothetical protein
MADTGAAPVLAEQVRRVRHAFHAAGDDHVHAAGRERVMGEDGGLHAAAAHLVDGGRLDVEWQARADAGLAGGRLAKARGQDAAHEDLLDALGIDAGALHRRTTAVAPSSVALTPARAPWNPPIGVRA